MKILNGHWTPETAYVVEDYPYGFRLRCRIRYWLEFKPGKGVRFWSQTSDPKKGHGGQVFNAASGLYSTIWNKPKASTFQRFGGVMFLNDEGRVTWDGLNEYHGVDECVKWNEQFGDTMPADARKVLTDWISRKLTFEQAKLDGVVKITTTCAEYGCITDAGFGRPTKTPTVKTTVIESDFTPEQLTEMGRTLNTRANFESQLSKFQTA